MNIAMFTNTFTPHVGGVARSVETFSGDLRSMGNSVLVICPTFDGQKESKTENLIRVPSVQNFNGGDFSIPLPLPFYIDNRLRAFASDLIHSHHPFLLGDAALRSARNLDKPLIFTHHTRYEEYTHYVSSESENMKNFVINLSREYGNMCDAVIAPSESIKNMLVKQGVSSPIEVIPTGTDISFYGNADPEPLKRKYGISPGKKIIGHVGRLAPEKNLEYLTKAVSIVLKRDKNCVFLVTGNGVMKDRIEEICDTEGVKDQLIMTGQLEGKDLASAYSSMDLFVFSSLSETQGMVLVEAMAAGTPVIALDAPGAREVVKSGENGELLDDHAIPDEFANAVEEYLSGKEKISRAKAGGLNTAKQFSRKASVAKLIDLYERVLNVSRPKRTYHTKSIESWEKILRNIKTEWELISEKTKALSSTFLS